MKRVLIVLGLLAITFAGAYVPLWLELRDTRATAEQVRLGLEARLHAAEERAQVATLASSLGMVLIEVRKDNYGNARQRSTAFFDQVRRLSSQASDDMLKRELMAILNRRDEVTTLLTANKPEASARLEDLFQELHGVISPKDPLQ